MGNKTQMWLFGRKNLPVIIILLQRLTAHFSQLLLRMKTNIFGRE
jgi:hypothetical protein